MTSFMLIFSFFYLNSKSGPPEAVRIYFLTLSDLRFLLRAYQIENVQNQQE